jgi:hypothetical protein
MVRIAAAAQLAEEEAEGYYADPDGYCKGGRRRLQSLLPSLLCWPLLHFIQALTKWVLPFWCLELSEAFVYLQAVAGLGFSCIYYAAYDQPICAKAQALLLLSMAPSLAQLHQHRF